MGQTCWCAVACAKAFRDRMSELKGAGASRALWHSRQVLAAAVRGASVKLHPDPEQTGGGNGGNVHFDQALLEAKVDTVLMPASFDAAKIAAATAKRMPDFPILGQRDTRGKLAAVQSNLLKCEQFAVARVLRFRRKEATITKICHSCRGTVVLWWDGWYYLVHGSIR